jgi:hypothetical protein
VHFRGNVDRKERGDLAQPTLTGDQRSTIEAQAGDDKTARSELLTSLNNGEKTLPQVLEVAKTDRVAGQTKVAQLLKALPGFGPTRVTKLLRQAGVDVGRRAAGLETPQRTALLEALDS